MKHILFPSDFSENSKHALNFAIKLANKATAKITLFNTYEQPPSRVGIMRSYTDILKKDSSDKLQELKSQIHSEDENKKLHINTESRIGNFVGLIPDVVKDIQADFIIMGAKGSTGIITQLVGSNTLEVIQNTECPVLVIPENAEFQNIDKIAFATDLRKIPHSENLKVLFDLARLFDSSIEFVNIIRKEDEGYAEEKAEQANLLESLAEGITTSLYMASEDNIIKGLGEYVLHHRPKMFAMLSRKHSLFERIFRTSTTKKLTFQTKLPLLVMSE